MSAILPELDRLEADLNASAKSRSTERLRDMLGAGAFVYGGGNFGRRIARLMREHGFECLGIVDRKAGSAPETLDGVRLIHPDSLPPSICAGRALVLGVFNPFHEMGEIVRAMRERGFADILWGADWPDAFGPSLNDFWIGSRAMLIRNFGRIRSAYGILSDDASRRTLDSVIRFRALDGDRPDPAPSYGTQYFPRDLPGFTQPISFLDGGAYDGDTFRALRGFGVEIDHWIAFEPDPQNFAKLTQFARGCGTQASLYPCGLAEKTDQLRFSAGNAMSSKIVGNEEVGVVIQCLAVDEALVKTQLDYVKLDIEGAEAAALRGMTETLRKYRPRLAISAYHAPEDAWEIPLLLKSILPDAEIYLRQHYPNTFDLVTYAIPAGR